MRWRLLLFQTPLPFLGPKWPSEKRLENEIEKKKHSLQFENVNICEREQVELEKLGDAESSAMAESPKPSLGENGDLIAVDEGGISTPILEEEEENSVDDSTATTSAGLNVDIFVPDEQFSSVTMK